MQMYDGLRNHAGWRHLCKKIKERGDELWLPILRRMKRGEVVDQREIDYTRGFLEGAVFAVTQPEVAENSLETAARMAWLVGVRDYEAEGEMTPNA